MSAAGHNQAGIERSGIPPSAKLRTVYLGIGSNIAPLENLLKALERLAQAVTILAVSTAWQTPAVGTPGPDFCNAAVSVRTALSREELKTRVIRPIETELGRVRTADKNAPRTIDIDILVDERELIEPDLWNDAFRAVPLAELIPGYLNPDGDLTLAQAAEQMKRTARITPRPEVLPGR